ncbi:hypothetical protein FJ366_02305 [Candidatus Dependentiae bacterium]|nr:hypothetical protein [Candidatus Dependentiae bacterium]
MLTKNLKAILLLVLATCGLVQSAQTPAQNQEAQISAIRAYLEKSLLEIERNYTEEQQQFLADLQETEGGKIALLFVDETEAPENFAELLKKMSMTAESAREAKAQIITKLEAQALTPAQARTFYETMKIMMEFMIAQQQMGQPQNVIATPESVAAAPQAGMPDQSSMEEALKQQLFSMNSDKAKAHEQKTKIHEQITKLENLKALLVLDPETQADEIAAVVERANEVRKRKYTLSAALKLREAALASLAELDVKAEEINGLIKENNALILQKLFANKMQALQIAAFGNTLFYDPVVDVSYFEQLVKKTNQTQEKKEDHIELKDVIGWRSQFLTYFNQQGISLYEFKNIFKAEIEKKKSEANKSLGYALLSSTAFGAADICKLHNQFAQKLPNSIINWFFGTVGYRNDSGKWQRSNSGLAARALELLALHPTTYLYKQAHLEEFSEQFQDTQMLQLAYDFFAQDWRVRAGLKIAPYLVPAGSIALNGNIHQQIPQEALAKHLGPIGGATASLVTSKILPALAWIAYLKHKKPFVFESISSLFTKDKHNVLNSGLMGVGSVGLALVKPLDSALAKKLTPKNSVFWKTFLNQQWLSKIAEIGYKTGLTAAAWKQFQDPANTSFNVVFGNEQTRSYENLDLNSDDNKKHKTWFETLFFRKPGQQRFLKIVDNFADGESREQYVRLPKPRFVTKQFATANGITTATVKTYEGFDNTDRSKCLSKKEFSVNRTNLSDEEKRAIPETLDEAVIPNADETTLQGDTGFHATGSFDPNHLTPGRIATQFGKKTWIDKKTFQQASPFTSAKEAGFDYAKRAFANLATKGLATAGITSLAVTKNKFIANSGAKISLFVLNFALKHNIITSETYEGLLTAKNGLKTLVKALFGFVIVLQTYEQNPSQLLMAPEMLPKILENLIENPEKLAPATREMQRMVHEKGAAVVYSVFIKKFVHALGVNRGWSMLQQQELLEKSPQQTETTLGDDNISSIFNKKTMRGTALKTVYGIAKLIAIVIPWALATAFLEEDEEPTPKKTFAGSFDEQQPLIPVL